MASDESIPQRVAGGHQFVSVSAGETSTCGVTTARELYCWGTLALETAPLSAPTQVIPDIRFTSVSLGVLRSGCALATTGDLYCWGENYYGQLGQGTVVNSPTPILVTRPED